MQKSWWLIKSSSGLLKQFPGLIWQREALENKHFEFFFCLSFLVDVDIDVDTDFWAIMMMSDEWWVLPDIRGKCKQIITITISSAPYTLSSLSRFPVKPSSSFLFLFFNLHLMINPQGTEQNSTVEMDVPGLIFWFVQRDRCVYYYNCTLPLRCH